MRHFKSCKGFQFRAVSSPSSIKSVGLCPNWPICNSFWPIFLLAVVDVFQAWCGPCKPVVNLFQKIRNEVGSNLLHFAVVRSHLALLEIPSPLKPAEVWGLKSLIFPIFSSNYKRAGVGAAGSEPAPWVYRGLSISTRIHIIKDFQASTTLCFPDFYLSK